LNVTFTVLVLYAVTDIQFTMKRPIKFSPRFIAEN